MTEADTEVELGAAEEESNTEAAPQGPGISTKSTSTPGTGSSAGGAPRFSTIYPTATAFPPFSGMPGGPPSTAVTLPSCLMPESFNSSGDFEDYIQQFKTAAMLADWLSPRHDHRPQYFELRLRDNSLHFYTTLSPEQQDDYDLLVDAFWQNYTTNVDILKAAKPEGCQAATRTGNRQLSLRFTNFSTSHLPRQPTLDWPHCPEEFRRRIKESDSSPGNEESKTQDCGRSTNISKRTRFVHCTGEDKLSRIRQPR